MGSALGKIYAADTAQVIYEDGAVMYICKSNIGTAVNVAKWQIKKVDSTSGIVIQWCDGNSDYDNYATDLATVKALSYS